MGTAVAGEGGWEGVMAAGKKERPLLHLVQGGKDPELFNADLEWAFCAADAACGYHSSMGGQVAVLQGTAGGSYATESNIYSEPQTGWPQGGGESYFTRSRRIWWALSRVSWENRRVLAMRYEPRAYIPTGYEGVTEKQVRAAHREYALRVQEWKREQKV